MPEIEIYDCTLREGEQAGGVSFSVSDRVEIVKALDELGLEFIEAGWPIHKEALDCFLELAKLNLKSKIVAFGSTSISENAEEDKNLNSIIESKAKYACIFGKTWLEHIEKQLKLTKEENLEKIKKSVEFLKNKGIEVFYDAEHYFDGFKGNKEYALETLKKAVDAGASRIVLCDTNGGTLPEETKEILEKTREFLADKFVGKLGVHIHNDSGLALTNSLESLNYVEHIQGTINGFGERVGNLDLCEFIPLLMLKKKIDLRIKLNKLKEVSDLVYKYANLPRKIGQAFVSERAFTHKGGVHIDAVSKGASYGHVSPEIFGLNHNFILTSLGGSACVVMAAKNFGISLDKKNKETRKRIEEVLSFLKEIEKKGYDIGNIEAEQYILIQKHFGNFKEYFKIIEWRITTSESKSTCYIKIIADREETETEKTVEGGPVDAIYKSLMYLLAKKYKDVEKIKLKDYRVRIAKSQGAESSVRTRIDFSPENFSAVGVSPNIIQSSLEALEKAFNYYLNKKDI